MIKHVSSTKKGTAHAVRFNHDPKIRTGNDMTAMPIRHNPNTMPTAWLVSGEGGPGITPMIGTVPE
jgi:hypothetical protein